MKSVQNYPFDRVHGHRQQTGAVALWQHVKCSKKHSIWRTTGAIRVYKDARSLVGQLIERPREQAPIGLPFGRLQFEANGSAGSLVVKCHEKLHTPY